MDPMHEVCIPHRIPRVWKQQGRSKKKQTRIIVIEKCEIWKDRGHYKEANPKQSITSDKELTIKLPEGREFPYHRLD